VRAGQMSLASFMSAESGMSRSPGTCMTMGTASTMASLAETLGLCLPGNGTIPAVDARRRTLAHETGRTIVHLVHEDVRPAAILSRASFENAIRVHAAIGGSTNAIIHLLAIAGRLGIPLALEDFDRLSREVPLLVDLQPSGRYLMEDFHYAGGVPAVLAALSGLLHGEARTVSGLTIAEIASQAECFNAEVIRPLSNPVKPNSGTWILRGNLCPLGAVMKPSAASTALCTHRGRAVVFESIEDFKARIDDPALEVDASSVLVLKGCGPKGYPGMPEVANLPLPPKLLARGITDMVRISDARMSGTAFGTVVLHVAPESSEGGTLAIVRDGDLIELDGPARRLSLLVPDDEIARRQREWQAQRAPSPPERGYAKLYREHVLQADRGCDFDFLVGASGAEVTRESH
jgi:dihydroxy-acid dehydratase